MHATTGAILMCQESRLEAPDLQQLCKRIVASQQESAYERPKVK
jgi:hypothetical protein